MGSVSPDALARLAAMRRVEDARAGVTEWSYDAAATLAAVTADLAGCGIRTTDKAPKPWPDGGRLWELTRCPYSNDHDDSAYLRQYGDGGVHVGCHHDRCRGKTIKSAPDRFPQTLAIKPEPPAGGSDKVTMAGKPVQDVTRRAGVAEPAGDDSAEPMSPAPAWPSGILPDALERYADAQARSIGVPLDMIAVPLLVFAGGVIGNMVRLQLKPAWNVYPTLWAGVIGDPAGKKSPTLQAAQWPLNALQDALYEQWRTARHQFEAELKAWESRPKGTRGERPESLSTPPTLEHVFTTDATMEALTRILTGSRGLTIIRDELSGFIGGMDKYRSKGDDRQNYLSLWAGTTIKVDRVGGGTLYATHPVAGVYGGIQPDRAGDLHNRDGSRDGMVERFLLFRPNVARSGWTDDTVEVALVDAAARLFADLRRFMPPTDAERITVKMHPDARRAFINWYNLNDAAVDRASGLRQGFYGKLDSQLVRVALVLHCLHNPDDPRPMVSIATIQAAIEVAEFFREHLDRVLPLLTASARDVIQSVDERILRQLRKPDNQNSERWVQHSVIYNGLRNVDKDALSDALARLEGAGTIETRIDPESTTKSARQWRFSQTPAFIHSDYSDDPAGTGPEGTEKGRIIRMYESGSTDNGQKATGTEGWVEV